MVSIIVPAYNCESYIDECINSLINQSYTDIEIIVIDDGSKDNTWRRLQEWSKRDHRVKAYHQNNAGVVTTRKRAVEFAQGGYLMFVDSDDYLPEDAVATMVDTAIINEADLVVSSYTLVWADSGKHIPVHHPKHFTTPIECAAYCLKYGETFLPIKLYHTSLYRETVDIPIDICVQEDTVGILQYLNKCDKVAHTDKSTYYYLKHNDSASYSLSPKHINSLLQVALILSKMYATYNDKKLLKEVVRSCIKNLYTYLRHTVPASRDSHSIEEVMKFIIHSDLKFRGSINYQLQCIKMSLAHPEIGGKMISLYESYLKIKKEIKECVRKVLK